MTGRSSSGEQPIDWLSVPVPGKLGDQHDAAALQPEGTVLHVWRIDLSGVREPRTVLSADELARADRFVVEPPRLQFERARAALRRLLAGYLKRAPESLQFRTGRHGKPRLTPETLSFNLSHSGEQAVLVVADRSFGDELGLDVECTNAERRLADLAGRFFAANEVTLFQSTPTRHQVELFYRLWTLKEAYLKAIGTGLTFSSRRFGFRCDREALELEENGPRLEFSDHEDDEIARWRFFEFRPSARSQAALCAPQPSAHCALDLRFFTYREETP